MVLLLVIFLPMLLEEEDQSPVAERDLVIPPQPEFGQGYPASISDRPSETTEPTSADYPAPVPEVAQPLPTELPPPALIEAPAAAAPEFEPEPVSEPAPILVDEAPPPAQEPAPAPAPAAAPEPPPAPKPSAPVPGRASADGPSWVIQAASLRDQKRATSLEQDLRGKGFPAFIEQAEVRGEMWHRVRVGPEADRKRIESMAASIKAQTGLSVQIQSYP
jgi:DedD protein